MLLSFCLFVFLRVYLWFVCMQVITLWFLISLWSFCHSSVNTRIQNLGPQAISLLRVLSFGVFFVFVRAWVQRVCV